MLPRQLNITPRNIEVPQDVIRGGPGTGGNRSATKATRTPAQKTGVPFCVSFQLTFAKSAGSSVFFAVT
jgi:hypothetical protein